MSTPANPQSIPTADQVVLPASNAVILDGVDQNLIAYVVHLGFIHWILFGSPLIVTSQWSVWLPDRARKDWNSVDRAAAAVRLHVRKVHPEKCLKIWSPTIEGTDSEKCN